MLERKVIQDISVIDINGDIDLREMIRIKDVIGSLIESDRTKVVLNLRAVDHINYLSIGVLLERLRILRSLDGDLKLAGMSPYLRKIFRVVGMDQFFEEYTSLEEAIESFAEDWEGSGTYH
ncbi:MAG: STAS domain-containing protein [Candidatus Binatia bacterium]